MFRSEMLYGMRILIMRLAAHFQERPKEQLEQLAKEIVEYGRMNTTSSESIVIEVPEVAYRLRESRRHVRQSLRLLEMKGIARKTNSRNYWKLSA